MRARRHTRHAGPRRMPLPLLFAPVQGGGGAACPSRAPHRAAGPRRCPRGPPHLSTDMSTPSGILFGSSMVSLMRRSSSLRGRGRRTALDPRSLPLREAHARARPLPEARVACPPRPAASGRAHERPLSPTWCSGAWRPSCRPPPGRARLGRAADQWVPSALLAVSAPDDQLPQGGVRPLRCAAAGLPRALRCAGGRNQSISIALCVGSKAFAPFTLDGDALDQAAAALQEAARAAARATRCAAAAADGRELVMVGDHRSISGKTRVVAFARSQCFSRRAAGRPSMPGGALLGPPVWSH